MTVTRILPTMGGGIRQIDINECHVAPDMLCDSRVGLQELYRALVLGQVQPLFLGKLRLGRALLLLQRALHVISPLLYLHN
jgi:hypothetical protein